MLADSKAGRSNSKQTLISLALEEAAVADTCTSALSVAQVGQDVHTPETAILQARTVSEIVNGTMVFVANNNEATWVEQENYSASSCTTVSVLVSTDSADEDLR